MCVLMLVNIIGLTREELIRNPVFMERRQAHGLCING